MEPNHRFNVIYMLIAVMLFLTFQNVYRNWQTTDPIPYS
jgi:cell division protease FtsH